MKLTVYVFCFVVGGNIGGVIGGVGVGTVPVPLGGFGTVVMGFGKPTCCQ